MKKHLLFCFICVALLLAGCSRSESRISTRIDLAALGPGNSDTFSQVGSPQAGTTQAKSNEGQRAFDLNSGARISVVTQETQDTYFTEDGKETLFYQQLQESVISIPSNQSAESAVNQSLQKAQAAARQESQNVLALARDTYASLQTFPQGESTSFYGYSYYTTDTVLRLDATVFSMTTYYSSYTGGAHPFNRQSATNYDMVSGASLSLADVLLPEGEKTLESMILQWLRARADDFCLYDSEEYETVVHEKFGQHALRTQMDSWYFSETGLVAFFNPYDIASYAACVVRIEFPYTELQDILEPRFFPVHVDNQGKGSISTALSGQIDRTAFETVEEIGADNGELQLSISGAPQVYDLSLSWISWVGDQPMTQNTIYVTNYLTERNLILVCLGEQADLNNLCIRFNPGDGTMVTAYLDPETGEATVSGNFGK